MKSSEKETHNKRWNDPHLGRNLCAMSAQIDRHTQQWLLLFTKCAKKHFDNKMKTCHVISAMHTLQCKLVLDR